MSESAREFDIVLLGATGFVGRLTAPLDDRQEAGGGGSVTGTRRVEKR